MSSKQFCTFRLNGYFFGVEVCWVQEIIRYQAMTYVPLAHSSIMGLINLRGHIVTAMDLRKRLGMEDRPFGSEAPVNVVIRTGEDPVSLLVDEIGDIMELSEENFETPPGTLKGRVRDLIDGAYKLKDELLLILNVRHTLDLPTENILTSPEERSDSPMASV